MRERELATVVVKSGVVVGGSSKGMVEGGSVARSHGCHGGFLQMYMRFLYTLCVVSEF